MSDTVNIADLDKADVLKALYDGSHTQGMSFFGVPDGGVTLEMCREAVSGEADNSSPHAVQRRPLYFDYWHGHVLKVDISGDEFDPWLYDRDCGEGAAEHAITSLRVTA